MKKRKEKDIKFERKRLRLHLTILSVRHFSRAKVLSVKVRLSQLLFEIWNYFLSFLSAPQFIVLIVLAARMTTSKNLWRNNGRNIRLMQIKCSHPPIYKKSKLRNAFISSLLFSRLISTKVMEMKKTRWDLCCFVPLWAR